MADSEREYVLTKVKRRSLWKADQDTSEGEETVNRYSIFAGGAAIFLAGLWALACLAGVFFQDGPLSMLRQLATAVTGH